ncbi:hypothetical protein HanRHA438_Chr16g0778041 [Helianthus annuus]|nr:hypothetical protein HanRHA438_Chr16g0778041 [Helianthus annuus]
MEKPARSPTGRPWWWLTATVTAVASRIPSRVPVSLIGRSRDRMGNLKVILNNRNVRVVTVPGRCSFSHSLCFSTVAATSFHLQTYLQ